MILFPVLSCCYISSIVRNKVSLLFVSQAWGHRSYVVHRRNSNLGLQFYMMAWRHIWSWRRKLAFIRVENYPSGRRNLLQLRTSSLCFVAGSFTIIANQLGPTNLGLETLHDGMWEDTWSWREEPSTTLQCSRFGAMWTDSTFYWTDLPYQTPNIFITILPDYTLHQTFLFSHSILQIDFNLQSRYWWVQIPRHQGPGHHGHVRGHAGHSQNVRGHAVLHGGAWGLRTTRTEERRKEEQEIA